MTDSAHRMQPGLHIYVVWFDEDVAEIRVRASNGRFGGVIETFESLDFAARLARSLRRFPTRREETRELVLGTFDPACAGGGVRLSLRCSDRAGHVLLDIALDTGSKPAAREFASFTMPIEPAGLDRFVDAPERMRVERLATVSLPGQGA